MAPGSSDRQIPDALIPFCHASDDFRGVIDGTIIHHDDLSRCKGLDKAAGDRSLDAPRHVVSRYHDRHRRSVFGFASFAEAGYVIPEQMLRFLSPRFEIRSDRRECPLLALFRERKQSLEARSPLEDVVKETAARRNDAFVDPQILEHHSPEMDEARARRFRTNEVTVTRCPEAVRLEPVDRIE